jgi:hypothetical protein
MKWPYRLCIIEQPRRIAKTIPKEETMTLIVMKALKTYIEEKESDLLPQ